MFSRRPVASHNRGRIAAAGGAAFDGLLATAFPLAYQILQFEFGLLYGSTPKATAGNTSTTVIALTGTIAGVPVPVWVVSTNSASIGAGATFNVYYDGLGVTPSMTGVTPTAGVPVALTGAGDGLSITFTAGTSVNANSWKATCAGLTDQSGNGKDGVQAISTSQPVVTAGLNGKPGLFFTRTAGVDAVMPSSLVLPLPGTTPWRGGLVVRRPTTAAAAARLVSDSGDVHNLILLGATSIQIYLNGSPGPIGTGLPTNTWGAVDWGLSNSAADYIKTGSGPLVSGAGAGNAASGARSFGGGASPADLELLAIMYAPASGFSSAAFRAAVTAIWGASVAV